MISSPIVYMLCGLTGSGKSTYSKELKAEQQIPRFSLDETYFELMGNERPAQHDYETEKQAEEQIIAEMKQLLADGQSLILDHGFWKKANRDKYRQLIQESGGTPKLIYFRVPKQELLRRLAERNKVAEVGTHIISPELLDTFYERFEEPSGEGEETIEWQALPDFISQNWPLTGIELHEVYRAEPRIVQRVSTDQGEFVIKAADPSKDKEAVERDTAIFDFLESNQFPAPKLLHTSNGQKYVQYDDRFWYILEYVDNTSIEDTPETWRAVGELMGKLHSLEGYTERTVFTFSSEIPHMLKRAKEFGIGEEYVRLVQNLPNLDILPQALIHTDMSLGNVIQQNNGSLVLIDWDDAGIGTRTLDVGFPLICAFVKDDAFNAENAKAFYKGYSSKIILMEEELTYLFDAALFFILSYSIFDGSGVHQENWQKAQWAAVHREEIEKVIYGKN